MHDQVTDLFERIEHGDALAPANRRGGLFQQLVRGLQLAAQPVGDPCAAVVRLVGQVPGEQALGLVLEQGDAPRPVENLGVGIRDE